MKKGLKGYASDVIISGQRTISVERKNYSSLKTLMMRMMMKRNQRKNL